MMKNNKVGTMRLIGRHTMAAMDAALGQGYLPMIKMALALVVVWHVYVPVHELMHVGAALMTGGTVDELTLKPQYGARLLQRVFPFVAVDEGGDYAGRLSGFEVPNRWAYAWVDLAPYVFSVFGVTLLEAARRRRSPVLFATGFVLAYIPWISVTGDFYECASLGVVSVVEGITGHTLPDFFISDDLFRLRGEMQEAGYTAPGWIAMVAITLAGAVGLIYLLMMAQWAVARRIFPTMISGK